MRVRKEVIPFVLASVAVGIVVWLICRMSGVSEPSTSLAGFLTALILTAYMLFFFRDPSRSDPVGENNAVVAGADGRVMRISEVEEKEYIKGKAVRISIFLSLFDVHVNRMPISGKIMFAGYFPGKRFFTFQEKSSEFNQHSSILIKGDRTSCLVNQIVGPVCRRVVFWVKSGQDVTRCERLGMMKFGSRLDMYFPLGDIEVTVTKGAMVRAGETVVAKIKAPEKRNDNHV